MTIYIAIGVGFILGYIVGSLSKELSYMSSDDMHVPSRKEWIHGRKR